MRNAAPDRALPQKLSPLRQAWRTWIRTRWARTEALLSVAIASLCVRFCFRPVAAWALRQRDPAAARRHPELEAWIGHLVEHAATRLPWESKCLSNAMAAKWMLARRGVPSTIHLGFGFNGSGDPHAHAWLSAGGAVITGDEGRSGVTYLPR